MILSSVVDFRPDRLTSVKDEAYHIRWGRYGLYWCYSNTLHTADLIRIRRNEDFYLNKQWNLREDVETFLRDQSGQERNRIRFTLNAIRGLVEQYRGNAIRLSLNARAKSISPMSISRYDRKLSEALFMTEQAMKNPRFFDAVKQRTLIGDNPQETAHIFKNTWVDEYVEAINDLVRYVANLNEFDNDIQIRVAESLALAGRAHVLDFEYGGEQRFTHVNPKDFFWDRNARRYDLQDAEGMGMIDYLSAPQILESAVRQLSQAEKQAIENYDRSIANRTSYNQGDNRTGIPVVTFYWRDTEPLWYGYVLDEFGMKMFTRINYVEPGAEVPRYTDADLVDPPSDERTRMRMKGQKKRRLDVDHIRFVRFIPYEAVADPNEKNKRKDKQESDVLLDFGALPYQEQEYQKFNNCKFPIKSYCWAYVDGEVASPIDDGIDPQRFINRSFSVLENQINNSGGAGPVFDQSALGEMTEEELLSNVNENKPIVLDTRGKGVPNAIGQYNANVNEKTYKMYELINAVYGVIKTSTGVNDEMQGQPSGADQLVGVTTQLIQRGSLMQEPFYFAVKQTMLQCMQAIATRGKKMYIDMERELVLAVGDESAKAIQLSRGMRNEDFRVFITSAMSDENLKIAANNLLVALKQLNLIDDKRFANLYDRATPELVSKSMREYAVEKELIAKEMMKQQQQQDEAMSQMMQQQMAQQQQDVQEGRAFELMKMEKKGQIDQDKIYTRASAKEIFRQPEAK